MLYRIAAATSDGVHVDGHFGRCRLFTILEAEDTTGAWHVAEQRTVALPEGEGMGHDPRFLYEVGALLGDCQYLMVSRIGPRPYGIMAQAGLSVLEISMSIEQAVSKLNAFRIQQQKRKERLVKQ